MTEPLVKNAADEEQVKEAKSKERYTQQQRSKDIKDLLALPSFRRFIYRHMSFCDRISVHPSGSMTYFNEGERNVHLQIKAELMDADPELYLVTMKEGKETR